MKPILTQVNQKAKNQNHETQCENCGEVLDQITLDRRRCLFGDDTLICDICFEKRRIQKMWENVHKHLVSCNIPKKHLDWSLENFKDNKILVKLCQDYAKNLVGSLVLTGSCGSGKTHLAVGIMRERIIQGHDEMLFITAPELLLKIRDTFNRQMQGQSLGDPRFGAHPSEEYLIQRYSQVDLLVLDDLGAEKPTEWAITTLYLIIDRRNREEKSTIFTTNLSLTEMEQQLSARIASRLADCKVIQLNMPDFRKKR